MAVPLRVEDLIEAAKRLAADDQKRLIRALASPKSEAKRRITELRGLGKEIWRGRDAQAYVNAERDAWRS